MYEEHVKDLITNHPLLSLEVLSVFAVYEERDKTEGRGGCDLRYTVADRAVASKLAVGLGTMGTPGDIRSIECIVLRYKAGAVIVPLAEVRLLNRDEADAVARRALLKLTPAEAEALKLHFAREQNETSRK